MGGALAAAAGEEPQTPAERQAAMRAVNPAFIPRNHRVEAVIQAAVAATTTRRSRNCWRCCRSPMRISRNSPTMPSRRSRISACCRPFAEPRRVNPPSTIARLPRASPRKLTNDQCAPHKSKRFVWGILPWTLWYSNSWVWRCSRFASSCWRFRRNGGHRPARARLTDDPPSESTSARTGRSRRVAAISALRKP